MPKATVGSLELVALIAVSRLGAAAYGLAVRHELLARTGRNYSVGTVYTTLTRLESKGLLRSRESAPLAVRGGRSRREYTITGAGARALTDARRLSASVWQGLDAHGKPELA